MKEPITITGGYTALGDKLCALCAVREFARRNPNLQVHFNRLDNVVQAYGDGLVLPGSKGKSILLHAHKRHRIKEGSPDKNYLGTYFAELGMDFQEPPRLELPILDPVPVLAGKKYIAFQPFSEFAQPNLSPEILDFILCQCKRHYDRIVCVGAENTMHNIKGVDYSHLGDAVNMLRVIRHARLVITPRSASAHIAAGYGIPAFIWVPKDGENWHLDYPAWDNIRVPVKSSKLQLNDKINMFLAKHL
jgi:ADP-heptose:LPS heptosyltransferase